MIMVEESFNGMADRDPRLDRFLEAAHRGETALVVEILRSGLDANAHDPGCSTALLMASRNGDIPTMRALLEHGAYPNPDGSRGYTALTHAIHRSLRGQGSGPLELLLAAGARYNLIDAVLANDLELVRTFLDEDGDPNEGEGSYNGPLLMQAARYGHVDMVELLLDYGADIEATDDLNRTPLEEAEEHGQVEVVRRLIDSGARRVRLPKKRNR